jgi:adenylate cyclase
MAQGSFRKRLYPTATGLLLVLVMMWLQFSDMPLMQQAMQRLDSLVYDLRLKAMLPERHVDPRIVIVDIDEKSLQTEGHWPWSRDKLGRLVDQLFEQGAAVVGFDVIFAEPERNSGETVLQRLTEAEGNNHALVRQLRDYLPLFDNNAAFAEKLQDRQVVLGYIFHTHGEEAVGALPRPLEVEPGDAVARLVMPDIVSYTGNIEVLQRAAHFGGFFTLQPDPDGIIRRAPIVVRHGGRLYPSLGLEVARLFLMTSKVELQTALVADQEILEAVWLGNIAVPTDSEGRVIIPYHGLWGTYSYVSATDVLQEKLPPGKLDNTVVLIGTTAQGLFDLRATPIQAVYPGVEVHANIIASVLDNSFPLEPAWASGADFLLSLLVGLTLALLFPRLAPLPLVVVSLAVLAAAIAFNFWMWSGHGLILALAPQLLLVAVLAVINMAYGFFGEFRGKRHLQGMFGQYVPPQLVQEMSENPEQYSFEGESREMTVLFADIRSFTTISEALSANDLKRMLNHFFTPMTRIIFDNRGTIDKYVGDMVMAFWGAPLEDRQHAAHAIDAALEMLREVERMKPEFQASGFPSIEIGIGVNSGIMNVGDMGSEYRRAYTVLGDAVNLASRLEGTTKYFRVSLVVGEETRRLAGDAYVFRELDLVRVKGKARAIHVFQPLCRCMDATDVLLAELAQHDEALACYRQQRWEQAEALFRQLHDQHPEVALYGLYLDRIAALRVTPPAGDWDGVYDRTEK